MTRTRSCLFGKAFSCIKYSRKLVIIARSQTKPCSMFTESRLQISCSLCVHVSLSLPACLSLSFCVSVLLCIHISIWSIFSKFLKNYFCDYIKIFQIQHRKWSTGVLPVFQSEIITWHLTPFTPSPYIDSITRELLQAFIERFRLHISNRYLHCIRRMWIIENHRLLRGLIVSIQLLNIRLKRGDFLLDRSQLIQLILKATLLPRDRNLRVQMLLDPLADHVRLQRELSAQLFMALLAGKLAL